MTGKVKRNEYGFEVFEDARSNSEGNDLSVFEEALADLTYTDVSGRKYAYIKRFFDIAVSLVALLVLLVPFLLVSLIIFIDNPGPVFFRQYRVGLKGKRFRLYKFRSMKVHAPKYMSTNDLVDSENYITRVGRILRKLSIDELPQLLNVLLGDMSIVGPRPLISDEQDVHMLRMRYGVYNVRPGITGLAQINGRDTVDVVDKVRYDVKYLNSYGLILDLRIIFATVPRVFGGRGVVEGKNHSKSLRM